MRKCMTCGAELADQESYCCSCGTKAPGGAVDKEEVELKYITPIEENPPHWTMSWRFHDFLTKVFKFYRHYSYHSLLLYNNLSVFNSDYYILFVYAIASFFINAESGIRTNWFIFGLINSVFVLMFAAAVVLLWITSYKLSNFQKNADILLYLLCMIRIVACPLYVIILSLIGAVPVYMSIVAIFEICYGTIWLIASYSYYSKRTKAFIN